VSFYTRLDITFSGMLIIDLVSGVQLCGTCFKQTPTLFFLVLWRNETTKLICGLKVFVFLSSKKLYVSFQTRPLTLAFVMQMNVISRVAFVCSRRTEHCIVYSLQNVIRRVRSSTNNIILSNKLNKMGVI